MSYRVRRHISIYPRQNFIENVWKRNHCQLIAVCLYRESRLARSVYHRTIRWYFMKSYFQQMKFSWVAKAMFLVSFWESTFRKYFFLSLLVTNYFTHVHVHTSTVTRHRIFFFFISLQHYGHDALPWNNGRNGTTSTRITSGCSGEKSSRISETNAHNMRVRVTCICQLSSVVFRFRSTQLLFFKFCMFTSSLLRIRTPSSP